MKYKIQFITIFLLSLSIFSQNSGSVSYQIHLNFNLNSKNQSNNEYLKSLVEESKHLQFQLDFNSTQSHFYFQNNMKKEVENNQNEKIISIMVANGDYYFDKATQKVIIQNNENILLSRDYSPSPWLITEESKMIDSYICYKATCTEMFKNRDGIEKSREIVAWFAPSLPYSFGPKQFNGLPGLILEITDNNITLLANKIEYKNQEEVKIKIPKGKIISESDYVKKLPEIPKR